MKNEHDSQSIALQCEVCLKEIPASVAANAEADEYVAHVCGLDCYQQWRDQNRANTHS